MCVCVFVNVNLCVCDSNCNIPKNAVWSDMSKCSLSRETKEDDNNKFIFVFENRNTNDARADKEEKNKKIILQIMKTNRINQNRSMIADCILILFFGNKK